MVSSDVLAWKRGLSLHYTCSRPIQVGRRHFKLSVDCNIVVLHECFALKSKQINGVFCAYQLDYVMVFKLLDQGACNKVLVFVYF